MNRILITGKNSELARDCLSRTISRVFSPTGSSHSQATCEVVFSSDKTSDAATGGTRQAARPSSSPHAHLPELEGHFISTGISMFFIGFLTVAALSLVLL